MPPKGGLADKIGNRYERRLALLRLLELLDEAHDSVRFRLEQPGEDDFEWWVEHGDGSRTYAQVKRQLDGDEQWTLAKLVGRGIIKDFGRQLKIASTAKCEFYSTLSASHLQDLTESARMAGDLQDFEGVFAAAKEKKQSWTKICDEWDWWGPEESWQALRKVTVGVISEPILETLLEAKARCLVSGDPATVVSLLGTYLEDHLSQEITAQDVWNHLATKQLTPNDWGRDPGTRVRINAVNQSYALGVAIDRGQLAAIRRTEADTIYGPLTSADGPPVVTVTGVAGMGKSELLGQVVEQLTAPPVDAAASQPLVLAARLDRLAGEFYDAAGLGAALGLPESPAVVLARLAAGGPAVLVLDQVDAFSSVSGRHPERFHAVTETLSQARAMGVRVLLACRTFDFHEDDRLQGLTVPAVEGFQIDLGPLPVHDVERALTAVGLTLAALPPTLQDLIRTPLHLRMLVMLGDRGEDTTGITTRLHLFDRFFKSVIREVHRIEPGAPAEEVTSILAVRLSTHQELTAPEARLSQYLVTVDHLISAGWLRKSDGRIGFAHEAYFDHAYARHHVHGELSLLELLRSAEQHLFRRSQVRQILTLEREQDRSQYLRDVRDVLAAADVRPHIKELVIALVTSVPDPTLQEWQALTVLGDGRTEPLSDRAHALAARSPAFGELLLTHGIVRDYLADPATAGFGVWLCRIMVRNNPDQVAALMQPHVDDPAWPPRIIDVINLAPLARSDAAVELFENSIKAGATDDPRHDVFTLLYATTDTAAAAGARIVGAYMSRRLVLHVAALSSADTEAEHEAGEKSVVREPESSLALAAPRDPRPVELLGIGYHSALDVIGKLAGQDPAAFVRHVLPVVRAASAATRTGHVTDRGEQDATFPQRPPQPPMAGGDNNTVLGHLAQAILAASGAGDSEAHAAVRDMAKSGLATEQVLAAAGFAAGHPDLIDNALAWLSGNSFALVQGWVFAPYGFSAEALTQVCQHRAPEQSAPAQQRAASVTSPAEEDGRLPKGSISQILLANIPASQLTKETLQHRNRLDTELGRVDTPANTIQPLGGFVRFAPLRPPISLQDVEAMEDDQLIQQLNDHAADGHAWQEDGQLIGGAISLAEVVTTATDHNPERFTTLLERSGLLPETYVAAILAGLDKARAGKRATSVQVLRAVMAAAPRVETYGRQSLAILIGNTTGYITPDDLTTANCTPQDLVAILRNIWTTTGATATPASTASGPAPRLPKEPAPKAEDNPDQGQLHLMEYGGDIAGQLVSTVWQHAEGTALDALRGLAESHPEAATALQEELQRFASSPDLVARVTALQIAGRTQSTNKATLAELLTTALDAPGLTMPPGSDYPADSRILLATLPLHTLLNTIGWGDYAAIETFAARMLDLRTAANTEDSTNRILASVAERAAHNAAFLTTYAYATDRAPAAERAFDAVAEGRVPERLGVATALADLQPVTAFPRRLVDALLKLCDDPNDAVARTALTTVRELPATDHPHVQDLLTNVAYTRAFELDPGPAVKAAMRCQEVYPGLVLDLAECFYELHGKKTSDLSSAAAAHAHMLTEVVTSIYARHPEGDLGHRALDLIDTMVLERSLGLEDRLGSHDR
ncbi:NACHT domain-containing protein [Kitasatospora sp. NPDC056273]|uniref:NACHT domain-containing protein n=1 Tax=Kitasatospora sp. NPDC056273 TaxID=3345769 RepID=UPI0035D8BA51